MPVVPNEVKWGEDNSIDNAPVLTGEDKWIIQQRMAALDKILAEEQKAKYKIELFFVERSSRKPTPGAS